MTAAVTDGARRLILAPLGFGKTHALLKIRAALEEKGAAVVFIDLFTAASTPERLIVALADSVRPVMKADAAEVNRLVDLGVRDRHAAPAALLKLMETIAREASSRPIVWLIDEVTEIRSLAYFPELGSIEKPFAAMLRAGRAAILTSSYMGLGADLFADFEPVALPGLGLEDLGNRARPANVTRDLASALTLTGGAASTLLPLLSDLETTGDAALSLARLLEAGAALELVCRRHYDILLMRSRGYAVSKRAAEVVALSRGLRLTDLVPMIGRTPGASRQYLRWLVEVGLLTQTKKRYDFADPVLGLWASVYLGRPDSPSSEQIEGAVRGRLEGVRPFELPDATPQTTRRPDRFEEID